MPSGFPIKSADNLRMRATKEALDHHQRREKTDSTTRILQSTAHGYDNDLYIENLWQLPVPPLLAVSIIMFIVI
jgi:hypothetical protein